MAAPIHFVIEDSLRRLTINSESAQRFPAGWQNKPNDVNVE